jgi:hypothetical protein
MEDREKYRAEMEAQMLKFNETLAQIKSKIQMRDENEPALSLNPFLEKQEKVQTKLKKMEQTDEKSWPEARAELDHLMDDVDAELRKVWAYLT